MKKLDKVRQKLALIRQKLDKNEEKSDSISVASFLFLMHPGIVFRGHVTSETTAATPGSLAGRLHKSRPGGSLPVSRGMALASP